jgi:hypothetical protein
MASSASKRKQDASSDLPIEVDLKKIKADPDEQVAI